MREDIDAGCAAAGRIDTIQDLVLRRGQDTPGALAYRFRDEHGHVAETLTRGELLDRASTLASQLAGRHGERALLLLAPGPDYVVALYACILAGVVAVPLYPPRKNGSAARVALVAEDCGATLALSTQALRARVEEGQVGGTALAALRWVIVDEPLPLTHAPLPGLRPDDLVVLQYTSGSEGDPKGVRISHANVMANLAAIHACAGHDASGHGVNWIPPYHDMGLFGGILYPWFAGFPTDLLPPQAFLRSPLQWLRLISETRATGSAAPNFALEVCVDAARGVDLGPLDLSAWRVCFVGAEPIRASTLDRFAWTFEPCGFRAETFLPSYGMAETTLLATGGRHDAAPVIVDVDRGALAEGRVAPATEPGGASTLVGCGPCAPGHEIVIVDPSAGQPCAPGTIGEIWVRGPSVTSGYWRTPANEEASRFATLHGDGDTRTFLRTGDLGFFHEKELVVTGRLHDLIIIRGRNHYPQDIERVAEGAHEALQPSGSACLLVDDRLVVVMEVRRTSLRGLDADDVARCVRRAVGDGLELAVGEVVFLKPGGLPRTSSGKVRRRPTAQALAAGTLPEVARWQASPAVSGPPPSVHQPRIDPRVDPRVDGILTWLREYGRTRVNSHLIDERRSIPPHIVLDFGNRGLLGLEIPPSHGGPGFGVADALRIVEHVAAVDTTLALLVGVNNALGVRPLLRHGSEAMKREWLPRLASGRELGAFAITEAGAGSHPQKIAATAQRTGPDSWRLDGDKVWSGNAGWAGLIHVFAHELDARGVRQGMTAFAVPQGIDGLRIGPEALTMGVRGMVQNSVHLRGVRMDASHVLGEPGRGFEVAQDAMARGRIGIAAIGLGAMKRCAQLMAHYAAGREVATGRLIDHAVVRERLSWLTAAIACCEALVYETAGLMDAGLDVPHDVFSACKILVPEFAWRAVDDLMQVLGGRGYVEPNLASRLMRDVRLLRIFEGPTETLAGYLGARSLAGDTTLPTFVTDGLGVPDSLGHLQDAARLLAVAQSGTDLQFARHACGDIAALTVLLAAARRRARGAGDPDASRAVTWAEALLDERLRAHGGGAARHVLVDAEAIATAVARYTADLGGWTQEAAGEDHALDEALAGAPRAQRVVSADGRDATAVDVPATAPGAAEEARVPARASIDDAGGAADVAALSDLIARRLAALMRVDAAGIDRQTDLVALGVDSLRAVQLIGEIEADTGLDLDPAMVWSCPTIDALAVAIAAMRDRPGLGQTPEPPTARPAAAAPEAAVSAVAATIAATTAAAGSGQAIAVEEAQPSPTTGPPRQTSLDFSLFYFSRQEREGQDPYRLLREGARFADQHGFAAVWLPERHFHPFGGPYPNPAVLAAALANQTRRVRLRAGSVVLPLEHPVRIVENWAVVDNLSGGRVDMAFVPGWNPDDFLLRPASFEGRREMMGPSLDLLERLWAGESVAFTNGAGRETAVRVYPRPVQPRLPAWLTCTGPIEGFIEAGRRGRHVLTALLFQSLDELATKVAAYRQARLDAGFDPDGGRVALMLHTYVARDGSVVDDVVRTPFLAYLEESVELWRRASARLDDLSPDERARVLQVAYERYRRSAALIGSVDDCTAFAAQVSAVGVDEIACLVDFGVDDDRVIASFEAIDAVRRRVQAPRRMPSPETALASTSRAPWVVRPRHVGEPRVRVLCVPYAGGDVSMFDGWGEALPADVEMCALDAPQDVDRMPALIDRLGPAVLPLLDRPFALHGHSVGALIAYELALWLRREHGHTPVHLFVASQHAPSVRFPYAPADIASALSTAPQRVRGRVQAAIDIQSVDYVPPSAEPLTCPISVVAGMDDPVLRRAHLLPWGGCTSGEFRLDMLPGGHLFGRAEQAAMLRVIAERLAARG